MVREWESMLSTAIERPTYAEEDGPVGIRVPRPKGVRKGGRRRKRQRHEGEGDGEASEEDEGADEDEPEGHADEGDAADVEEEVPVAATVEEEVPVAANVEEEVPVAATVEDEIAQTLTEMLDADEATVVDFLDSGMAGAETQPSQEPSQASGDAATETPPRPRHVRPPTYPGPSHEKAKDIFHPRRM